MPKRESLGRGLAALLPGGESQGAARGVVEIPIEKIHRNPAQPRKRFDKSALEALAASIAQRGVLQPLIVTPDGEGYLLLAGERRWRASQLAGLHAVPVVTRQNVGEAERLEIALIENLQREDLNPIEEAQGYRQLMERHGYTQETVAQMAGRSRPAVANALRLLTLPDSVSQMVVEGTLSAGHARALLPLNDPVAMRRLAESVTREGLSVRDVEREVTRATRPQPAPSPKSEESRAATQARIHYEHLEDSLSRQTNLKVSIKPHTNSTGEVTLSYRSLDEFDAIVARLKAK